MKYENESVPKIPGPVLPDVDVHAFTMNADVFVRDPFILPYDGRYYLYHNECIDGKTVVAVWVSEDLKNWSRPYPVLVPEEGFHGVKDLFWAPECHYYKGAFYLFTSVRDADEIHRVSVYKSASPMGPFRDIADGCLPPRDVCTIDGTLYVDPDGNPWLVYVNEWISHPDRVGLIDAVRLTDDLSAMAGEPISLFRADAVKDLLYGVTDGPFLYTTETGELRMLWSTFTQNDYVVAVAGAPCITGPWTQKGILYERKPEAGHPYEGGHAMIFKTIDGKMKLALHTPNANRNGVCEHLSLLDIAEENGELVLK